MVVAYSIILSVVVVKQKFAGKIKIHVSIFGKGQDHNLQFSPRTLLSINP